MKTYEYVPLVIGGFFRSGNLEHRKIIDEYSAKGYRYAGFIPTEIEGYGRVKKIDLIFEKEARTAGAGG